MAATEQLIQIVPLEELLSQVTPFDAKNIGRTALVVNMICPETQQECTRWGEPSCCASGPGWVPDEPGAGGQGGTTPTNPDPPKEDPTPPRR